MKICLTGGTGFIGTRVSDFFKQKGFDVDNITRSDLSKPISNWKDKINGSNLLINLAGTPIYKRWTTKYKQEILSSRVETSLSLVEAFALVNDKPPLVISASAVGIYDNYNTHDEFSDQLGQGFLAEVCDRWEAAIAPVETKETRLATIRLGVVLDDKGGALAKMLPSFKLGMGAVIGNGAQAFPCIHVADFLSAIWFIYQNKESKGIYNMVAPDIVSNKQFSQQLGKVLNKPVLFNVPKLLLNLGLGEGAAVLTEGQKVKPRRLLEAGFTYQFLDIKSILEDVFK